MNSQKIKRLEKELSEELKAAVIRRLNTMAEAGEKIPRKRAFVTLRKISMQEAQKLKRKIVKLANLIRDPKNPMAPRKIKFDLKSSEVKAAFFSIVKHEKGELAGRAAALINEQIELASRATADYINSMLNTR